jgi:hypothetical protein
MPNFKALTPWQLRQLYDVDQDCAKVYFGRALRCSVAVPPHRRTPAVSDELFETMKLEVQRIWHESCDIVEAFEDDGAGLGLRIRADLGRNW